MYLLNLSFRPWRKSPYSQIFTAVAVGILLFLSSFLVWMQRGLNPVIQRLQDEQVITAYLDPALNAQGVNDVADSIRTSVGAHAEVELVHADRFINHIKGDYPELARELEDLGSEMQTVIPQYVSISGLLPSGTLGEVKGIRGVQSAETSMDRFKNVIGAFRALKWIATLLTIGLGIALMTGLVHLGKMNSYLHCDSSSLMKLMGASQTALCMPGLISGILVGLLGGLIASLGWLTLGMSMTRYVRSLSPLLQSMSPSAQSFAWFLLLGGLFSGMISGLSGATQAGTRSQ
jgi:cell division protein FtsX